MPKDTAPEGVIAIFRRNGWILGNGDVPRCAVHATIRKPKMTTEKAPPPTLVPGPDPKLLRRVYTLLDEWFNETTHLYAKGWDDARVAKEAGTSPELVTLHRAKAYGELAENPEIVALREEIALLRMEAEEVVKKAAALEARLDVKQRKAG